MNTKTQATNSLFKIGIMEMLLKVKAASAHMDTTY